MSMFNSTGSRVSRLAPVRPPDRDLGKLRSDASWVSLGRIRSSFSGVMACPKNKSAEPGELTFDDFLEQSDGRLVLCRLAASCASSFIIAIDRRLSDATDGREEPCVVVEPSFSSHITSKLDCPATYFVEHRRSVGPAEGAPGTEMLDSTIVSVHTVTAGNVSAGWAPLLPIEAALTLLVLEKRVLFGGPGSLGIADRENVETKYESRLDLSWSNVGSGKKVNSILFGALFVLARRSVIMAGLSFAILNVACLTVERRGVNARVAMDFEGRVQRLSIF